MKLRRLTPADAPQVIAIQESITRQAASQRWRDMLSEHIENPHKLGLVAEADGKVLGFVIGTITVGHFGRDLTGWLEMVGVAPDQMGSGVGRALGQGLLDAFKEMGVPEVMTAVRWDSGDMLAFFKSLGFDRSPYINLVLDINK